MPRAGAVFVDRDGTINIDTGYMSDPAALRLIGGAARAIRRLNRDGRRVIVVTNQSGVARGLLDEAALLRMHDRLRELLAVEGARVDAIYACPHLPEGAAVPRYGIECDCRKPADGLLRRAAADWDIDLSRSWMIGDNPTDAEAGRRAGCRTVLIGNEPSEHADHLAGDLAGAVEILFAEASE